MNKLFGYKKKYDRHNRKLKANITFHELLQAEKSRFGLLGWNILPSVGRATAQSKTRARALINCLGKVNIPIIYSMS